jgi:photosynthetic reaction center H subunit
MNGAPLVPVGNPLLAGVGPGSYANRQDVPDAGLHGEPRILPKRLLTGWEVITGDENPIGLTVYGADLKEAGVISDIWIDHMESLIRYIEVQLSSGKKVLIPFNFATFNKFGVDVNAILASQFEDVPSLKNPDQITLLEEEKIMAYYGAGTLYATPSRQEPLL